MNKKFRQQYFAFRNGYQCGRCMKAGLLYEGEPHMDAVGVVCEPPNDLALADSGSNAENVPIVPIPPSPTNPDERPINVDIDDGVGKLKPIQIDEHGDVIG